MDSPLRILHVVVNMNRGGAETLIMNLYRNIDRSKVQFDFLTCKEGVFDQEIKEMGGNIYRIPYISEVGHFRYKSLLSEFFLKHRKYKVVHSHLDKMSGLVLQAAKQANIPVRIAHSHNTSSEGGALTKCYKWYAGTYIKREATHLYACSNAAAKWLFGRKAKHAEILPNGIEPSKFAYSEPLRNQLRSEWGLDSETIALGHVGRFAPQKNHEFLLEVFAQVHKQTPNSVLVLVGDGPLRESVLYKINQLKLNGKVKLLGVREDIHQILQAFDVFLFPSLHEGLPVTLVEAQGAGLPCIISNRITLEVDMGAGLVHGLPINDEQRWVDQVSKLTNTSHTRNVSKKVLAFKGYDIQRTAQLTQNSYLTLGDKVI